MEESLVRKRTVTTDITENPSPKKIQEPPNKYRGTYRHFSKRETEKRHLAQNIHDADIQQASKRVVCYEKFTYE